MAGADQAAGSPLVPGAATAGAAGSAVAAAQPFVERSYTSADGLALAYRDYPGPAGLPASRPTIVCLPGLTRNARDFEVVASRLSAGWRVLCPSLRGRGSSAYARDSGTYLPAVYVQDLFGLFEAAAVSRIVAVGTSLGGILTLLIAAADARRIAGAVLNDIGPVLDTRGLERIVRQLGRGLSCPTWMHAAREVAEIQASQFPNYVTEDWLRMAKRLCRLTPEGRIVLDFDPRIAEPFRSPGGAAPADLWLALQALAPVPVLSVRGALSDIFSAETQAAMAERLPNLRAVTVPGVGHAPTLEEPEAADAVDALLDEVLAREASRA